MMGTLVIMDTIPGGLKGGVSMSPLGLRSALSEECMIQQTPQSPHSNGRTRPAGSEFPWLQGPITAGRRDT